MLRPIFITVRRRKEVQVEANLTFSLSKLSVQKTSIPTTTTPGGQRLHGLKRSMAGDFFVEDEDESIGEQPEYGKRHFEEMSFREGMEAEETREGGGLGGGDDLTEERGLRIMDGGGKKRKHRGRFRR